MSTCTISQCAAQQSSSPAANNSSNVISCGSAAAAGLQTIAVADTGSLASDTYSIRATLDGCLMSDTIKNCRMDGNDVIMTLDNGDEVRVASRLTSCVPVDVCVAMDILKYDIRHFTITMETPCTMNHETVHDALLTYFHDMNIEFDKFRCRILSWSVVQDFG